LDGVLVVDKPQGLTSHDVVAAVRRAIGERRIGHTGTLDPLATGVLPLACGRATRLARFLSASTKDYDTTIRFGLCTDTYDISGRETSRSDLRPTRDAVQQALAALTGEHLQTPPPYSAKKVAGTRAYDLARRNETVELKPSRVTLVHAELLAFDEGAAEVRLTCSAGFYVRSLVHTLGERLGTGACLEALRRTKSGEFTLAQAVGLDGVLSAPQGVAPHIVPMNRLLESFPAIRLSDEERRRVSHGQSVEARESAAEWVRLVDKDGDLVALATAGPRADVLHPAVVLI
jgi:tRNA pseudouridine55 synthase